jgi:hypothetical protein
MGHFSRVADFIEGLPPGIQAQERWVTLSEQIYFRLGDTKKLRTLFSEIDLHSLGPEPESRLVNISACLALIPDPDLAISLLPPTPDVWQLSNTATALFLTGNFPKALELIGRAEAQDCSALSRTALSVLRASILAKTDPQEATEQFTAIVEGENVHPRLKAVAESNYACLALDSGHSLAKQRGSFFDTSEIYQDKSQSEIEAFLVNRFLSLQKVGQTGQATKVMEDARRCPGLNPLIPEAFCRVLGLRLDSTPYSVLVAAQDLINRGRFEEAAEALAHSQLSNHPRTVSVVARLLARAGKAEKAMSFLSDFYQKIVDGEVHCAMREFLEFTALFALRVGSGREAVDWTERLLRENSVLNRSVELVRLPTALLALALAKADDLEQAEYRIAKIETPKLSDAELDALEASVKLVGWKVGNPGPPVVSAQVFGMERSKKRRNLSPGMLVEKLKRIKDAKRKRRRLQKPRNYDPSKISDPERWIPLNKRTGRGKKKPAVNQSKGGIQTAKKQAPARNRKK